MLKKAEHPLVIVGMGALTRPDGAAIASLAAKASVGAGTEGWNGYSVLHTAAARVGALDLGFVPGSGGRNAAQMAAPGALDVAFLLGADEIDIAPGAFVVYIGTHGDQGAHRADVILPGAAYPEKSGIYVNTEGRVQMAGRASFPPGEAREDWAILRALSDVLGQKLPYDSLAQLRQALFKAHPHLQRIDQIAAGNRADIAALAALGGTPDKAPFGPGNRRLLSHQSDRARVGGHGGMLGDRRGQRRAAPRRNRRRPMDSGEFWTNYIWPRDRHRGAERAAARPAAGRHRLRALCRPQDLGGGADAARPQRGRALGPAAVLRRSHQVRGQGADHSRPAPTRACSCWRRSSRRCWRCRPGR